MRNLGLAWLAGSGLGSLMRLSSHPDQGCTHLQVLLGLAKVCLLAMWSNHVTGRLMLAMARVLNSSSSSLSMGHFICGCLVSNPRDQGGSNNTFYNLRSHF